jgi:hypothetical protein
VPVPEAVVDDTDFDLWGEVQQGLAEAVGFTLDAAVCAGTNKPATWAQALIPGAVAAGNTNVADSPPARGGAANDVAETFADVEDDGYDVTAIAATRGLRGILRKARERDELATVRRRELTARRGRHADRARRAPGRVVGRGAGAASTCRRRCQ